MQTNTACLSICSCLLIALALLHGVAGLGLEAGEVGRWGSQVGALFVASRKKPLRLFRRSNGVNSGAGAGAGCRVVHRRIYSRSSIRGRRSGS